MSRNILNELLLTQISFLPLDVQFVFSLREDVCYLHFSHLKFRPHNSLARQHVNVANRKLFTNLRLRWRRPITARYSFRFECITRQI